MAAVDVTLARERENERHLDVAQLRYLELSGTAYRRRVTWMYGTIGHYPRLFRFSNMASMWVAPIREWIHVHLLVLHLPG